MFKSKLTVYQLAVRKNNGSQFSKLQLNLHVKYLVTPTTYGLSTWAALDVDSSTHNVDFMLQTN